MTRDPEDYCTCCAPFTTGHWIDPPEVKRDPRCPIHGTIDPDYERENRLERAALAEAEGRAG